MDYSKSEKYSKSTLKSSLHGKKQEAELVRLQQTFNKMKKQN